MADYDVIIIGAGLSGLAAGIRLAHFGRKVAIMEKHHRVGGMNSWYRRQGRDLDVGLHAMTNFAPLENRPAPLNKLFRQLRLPRRELELTEQKHSLIRFPNAELRFSNDFQELTDEIAKTFPSDIPNFRDLIKKVNDFDSFSLQPPKDSTRKILNATISSPLLREMLICPLMYYGNAAEDDMDFAQFCVMFKSVFQEGLCRPKHGIRPLLKMLTDRYSQAGGELYLKRGVKSLEINGNNVSQICLSDGSQLKARAVLSCAGYPETLALCGNNVPVAVDNGKIGNMSFVEGIFGFSEPLGKSAFDNTTIEFRSNSHSFSYRCPNEKTSSDSEVLCFPDNFQEPDPEWRRRGETRVRVTRIANYEQWASLGREDYRQAKKGLRKSMLESLEKRFPEIQNKLVFDDIFTPVTIEAYTGRLRGSVYGSPDKHRDGTTPFNNLFICGTDQGFLGIVGSLLSGLSIANYHFLQ